MKGVIYLQNHFLMFYLIFSLSAVTHALNTSSPSSTIRCLPHQSSALLQLKQEFVLKNLTFTDQFGFYGPERVISSPKMKLWKAGTDCCEWDGVACNTKTGHVVKLDLSSSGLVGPLLPNSRLFNLHQLRRLNLAINNFTFSQIPSTFGRLSRLTHLNLSHSVFSGRIPSEITWLTSLVSLDLSSNLVGYTDEGEPIGLLYLRMTTLAQNMTNLRELHLNFVNLSSSLPDQFLANLSSLTSLSLSGCNLHGMFPKDIFLLPNITIIDVSDNTNLTGFLPEFHYGSNLQSLILYGTDFYGTLPDSIGNMKSLIVLDLCTCNFSGAIPYTVGNLSHLTTLYLSSNDFSGHLPSTLGNLSLLACLGISQNNFIGQLPSTLGNLVQLKTLDISQNNLNGQLPSTLGNLVQLTSLGISHNNLNGQLPSTLGNLVQLTTLDISQNNLNGQLPSTLGNLSQLTFLSISQNNFIGQLPSTLRNLVQLKTLDFSQNNLTGQLPSTLGNLVQLTTLDISQNNLNGQLPSTLGNLSQLTFLGISQNNLNGQLPSTLGNLVQLKTLDISQNNLNGQLPSTLGNLVQLTTLDISQNNLNGQLPSTLRNLSQVIRLDLSANNFVNQLSSSKLQDISLDEDNLNGQIPAVISKLKNLEILSLASNNFSWTFELDMIFPEHSKVRTLDLSYNRNVSLQIKGASSSLPKFQYLYLSSCCISKRFPEFLTTQDKLRYLDISDNQIEGKIPSWFLNIGIDTLSYLNLSHNSFSRWEKDGNIILPWKYLQVLDLRSNTLQGPLMVPPFSTKYFLVSENKLTGRIHPLFCNLRDLIVLDLSNNILNGTIPQCLGSSSRNLLVLNTKGNNFHGKIPKMCLDGSNLQTLDLSYNKLQGKVSQSLINCRALEVLNLGHNQIDDVFPLWLQNLPELKVLVLRSNKFHGPLWHPQKVLGFLKLHILDLSFNSFNGDLSPEFFKNWSAIDFEIRASNKSELRYMKDDNGYYQDSVTVTVKGLEMEFVKILTIFTSIDLSSNNFHGEIPSTIGELKSLIVLNLSNNNFEGLIPSSLGNLTELESLDLSKNKLSGRIPPELVGLTFLEYLNLSDNRLAGSIPQGQQFDTFSNSSFAGNLDLCGVPLSKKCESIEETPSLEHSQESESENGFGWKAVLVGYICGFLVGAIGGYVLFSKKPNWLVRIYGRKM